MKKNFLKEWWDNRPEDSELPDEKDIVNEHKGWNIRDYLDDGYIIKNESRNYITLEKPKRFNWGIFSIITIITLLIDLISGMIPIITLIAWAMLGLLYFFRSAEVLTLERIHHKRH